MEPSNCPDHQPDRERRALGYALAAVAGWSTVATASSSGCAGSPRRNCCSLARWSPRSCSPSPPRARRCWRIDPRSLAQAGALRPGEPVLYYLVLFEAYDRLPAQIAQPLNYTWAIVLACWPCRCSASPDRAHGWPASGRLSGCALLLTRGGSTAGRPRLAGVILALGSTVIWAGYWLANARSTGAAVDPDGLELPARHAGARAGVLVGTGLAAADAGTPRLRAWVGLLEMGFTFLLWQRRCA
jgi:threonine/homoserine efflux transporter RhtA